MRMEQVQMKMFALICLNAMYLQLIKYYLNLLFVEENIKNNFT